eukprot:CAMPEP_0119128030 /NCGR_PEP_ID=MMETSP1310-20130426/6341_1 /TAXON_ID=464262 /ORGANISM="Genus nov. species nov., Strain RCC2339" /LENGTH=1065 /DNA_ID=CAMNT_0007118327 /DNA_START=234 /DNA_END=3427 /DNA_ORIENTATION=-
MSTSLSSLASSPLPRAGGGRWVFGWQLLLHGVAVTLFLSGFFLVRYEIPPAELQSGAGHGAESSPAHAGPRRAVLVLIDALRYDFLLYDNRTAAEPYANGLPHVAELVAQRPSESFLFRFVADAPTTTMQRLKALTTGSLPTFVDVKDNLQSAEVTEDNLVDALRRAGKRVWFFGDDTWTGLFPGDFDCAFAFPSFDVKDLHSVDNGVLCHAIPELTGRAPAPTSPPCVATYGPDRPVPTCGEGAWDVLILHFLGLDHVGHRHGPSHEAARQKLAQLDGFLRNLTAVLEEDTVLFVMGDHGMTPDGNHGGASADEVDAGLFVYSPGGLYPAPAPPPAPPARLRRGVRALTRNRPWRAVDQIDFVPTFARLLGVPIPNSNLGTVIPEFFLGIQAGTNPDDTLRAALARAGVTALATDHRRPEESLRDLERQLASAQFVGSPAPLCAVLTGLVRINAALLENAAQVFEYLRAYAERAPMFADAELDRLHGLHTRLEDTRRAARARQADALAAAAAGCSAAPGPDPDIGVVVRAAALEYHDFVHYRGLLRDVVAHARLQWVSFDLTAMALGLAVFVGAAACALLFILHTAQHGVPLFSPMLVAGGAAAGGGLALLALGPGYWPALLAASALGSVAGGVATSTQPFLRVWEDFRYFLFHAFRDTFARTVLLRPGPRLGPGAIAPKSSSLPVYLLLCLLYALRAAGLYSNSYIEAEADVILFLLATGLVGLFGTTGSPGRGGWVAPVAVYLAALRATGPLAAGSWRHERDESPLITLVYVAALGVLVRGFVSARGTILGLRGGGIADALALGSAVPAALFWAVQGGVFGEPYRATTFTLFQWLPLVTYAMAAVGCGLAVVRSRRRAPEETAAALVLALLPALALLGGGRSSLSLLLGGVTALALGRIVATVLGDSCDYDNEERTTVVLIWAGTMWALWSVHLFYGTGHSFDFNSLHFDCAFVGFDRFDYTTGAVMLASNTWTSVIMAVLGLPLLARGSARFFGWEDQRSYSASLLPILRAAYLFSALWPAMHTAFFVYGARRHLMVWRIFAPKLAFECATLLFQDVLLCL